MVPFSAGDAMRAALELEPEEVSISRMEKELLPR
jgi:hypothetical protein